MLNTAWTGQIVLQSQNKFITFGKIIISQLQLLNCTWKWETGYLLSLNLVILLSALVVKTLEMKQRRHHVQSTAELASIINAPYKCLSRRIKELKDKLKVLIMKGKVFCNWWEFAPKYVSYWDMLMFAGILSFNPPISTEKQKICYWILVPDSDVSYIGANLE